MWAEFAGSCFLVAMTLALQMFCPFLFKSVQLAPRTLGVFLASMTLLDRPVAQAGGFFFGLHLQVSWGFPIFLSLGCFGYELVQQSRENVVLASGLVSLTFVALHHIMLTMGAFKDVAFVPLVFAFFSATVVWIFWFWKTESRLFALFVMGGMVNLLLQMFLLLVPTLETIHALIVPMTLYLVPTFFLGYISFERKKPFE